MRLLALLPVVCVVGLSGCSDGSSDLSRQMTPGLAAAEKAEAFDLNTGVESLQDLIPLTKGQQNQISQAIFYCNPAQATVSNLTKTRAAYRKQAAQLQKSHGQYRLIAGELQRGKLSSQLIGAQTPEVQQVAYDWNELMSASLQFLQTSGPQLRVLRQSNVAAVKAVDNAILVRGGKVSAAKTRAYLRSCSANVESLRDLVRQRDNSEPYEQAASRLKFSKQGLVESFGVNSETKALGEQLQADSQAP
jgi:hypothetical protein